MANDVLGAFNVHRTDRRRGRLTGTFRRPEHRSNRAPARFGGDGSASTELADEGLGVLRALVNESPDVEAAALVSDDGLMIASVLPIEIDETRVAGVAATLLGLGVRAAAEFGRSVDDVVVRGDQGCAVILTAGGGVLLLALANEDARLGLILFDMREAISNLAGSLDSPNR